MSKRMPVRIGVLAIASAFACIRLDALAQSQDCCPGECCPASIVVPFSPGGSADFVARQFATVLATLLRTQVVVDNRAGSGGALAMQYAAQRVPDGSSVLLGTNGVLFTSQLSTKARLSLTSDFTPVGRIAVAPQVLLVPVGTRFSSVRELVDQARRNPGKVTFGSSGTASVSQLAGELFSQSADVRFSHVPYKGSGPALTDLLAGQVDFGFFEAASALAQIRAGRARALAVTSKTRLPALPNVPTMQEAGVPEADLQDWYGLFLPKSTPNVVVGRWQKVLLQAAADTELRERLQANGMLVEPIAGEQFANFLRNESQKTATVARRADIKID